MWGSIRMDPVSVVCGNLGTWQVTVPYGQTRRWIRHKLEQKWSEQIKHRIGACPPNHEN